jgi:phosphate butyryltransferase
MIFSGELPIASKGQILTSYIYHSIIREEAKACTGANIGVISFWEIPGLDHLVAITDTGVNIKPDAKAKLEICSTEVEE